MRTARTLIASLFSTDGLLVVTRALLTCTACTFCQPTVDFHCVYRALMDFVVFREIFWIISSLTVHLICTAYTVVSFHSSTMEYTYYLEYGNYIVFSSSSRRGFALWASAVDAHLFVPFPTERFRTVTLLRSEGNEL